MEKKTIGAFLAALRRARGMTQKELGEKLGVSDKAVSRWERDECAPDLTLIPVLAEIFDVTSDEILRGQRLNRPIEYEKQENKTEKQISALLRNSQLKLSNRSIIAIGIAVTGLFAAMICNSGFDRAYIGFFAACIFYAAALVCQFIFTSSAFNAVNCEDFQTEASDLCKYTMANTAFRSFAAIILLFVFTLPLIVFPWNGHVGIVFGDFILYGVIFTVIALGIIALCRPSVFRALTRRGVFKLSESETALFEKLSALTKKTFFVTLIVLIVTAIPHFFVASADASSFTEGTVFDNFTDFKEYMETPTPDDSGIYYAYENGFYSGNAKPYHETASCQHITFRYSSGLIDHLHTNAVSVPTDSTTYYDSFGNVISEEEALTEELRDKDGNVIYTYMNLNNSVSRITYSAITKDNFHVTVYTNRDISRGITVRENIVIIFCMVYFLEIIAAIVIYIVKRRKITISPVDK